MIKSLPDVTNSQSYSKSKILLITDLETIIEAQNQFLLNASHNNETGLPLICIYQIIDIL